MIFQKGEAVEITCEDRTVEGQIMLISPNQVAAMIAFEAILGGHVGRMPVMKHSDGVYRSIIDGTEVRISKKRLAS